MNGTRRVRVPQGIGDGRDNLNGLLPCRLIALQPFRQTLSFQEVGDDVAFAVLNTHVVNGENGRMFQLRQPSSFLQKFVGFRSGTATCCHFDGNCSIKLIVVPEKDGPKSSLANLANHAITAIGWQCLDFTRIRRLRRGGCGERIALNDRRIVRFGFLFAALVDGLVVRLACHGPNPKLVGV